jgi:cytochrome c oxidase subunit 1
MSQHNTTSQASFQGAQAQRWNLIGGFQAAMTAPTAKNELRGWCGLALLSLAIAGVFALLLAVSRVPGIQDVFPWPLQFFQKGLVIHVIFSFVVWFLSVLGGLSVIAIHRIRSGNPSMNWAGKLALLMGYVSSVLLFVPGFMDRGDASLNNYVPVIIDPLYYGGLIILALGLLLLFIRFAINLTQLDGPFEPITQGTFFAGVMLVLSLVCFGLSWLALGDGEINGGYNEDLFWGGGHLLQYLNTTLMLVAWYILGGIAFGRPLVDPRQFRMILGLIFIISLILPALYIVYEPISVDQRDAFTWMQYGLAPPTVLMCLAMFSSARAYRLQSDRWPWQDAAFLCLFTSILVFGIGGFLGLFVDGTDTRTPAHYHGVIGGINLTFMGLFIVLFLPLMDRVVKTTKSVLTLIWFYATGQTFHSLGLFLAGGYGAPRKTAGADQGIEALGAKIGLNLMGVGAVIAVIGGIMFIWIVSAALLRRDQQS